MRNFISRRRAEIFSGTMSKIESDKELQEAVKASCKQQKYFPENLKIENAPSLHEDKCETAVSSKRSCEAARQYVNGSDKVCVLNINKNIPDLLILHLNKLRESYFVFNINESVFLFSKVLTTVILCGKI